MWRRFGSALFVVVALAWAGSGETRAASFTLPTPLHYENFDSVPEGTLPAGWSGTNFTEALTPAIDFGNLDSAAYAGWTAVTVSRFAGPLVQYSNPANATPVYQRVLSLNPGIVVNGQPLTNLASGRCLFANSGYRRGRSQVQYLFTPDYDLSGQTNVFLSFHSLYEQNQDSFGAVEYSTNQGATWLPIIYLLDSADLLSMGGAVDASATLSTVYPDVATYVEPGSGIVRGGFYGAFIGASSDLWPTLGPHLSGRINDDASESKRVELFRLAAADQQARVRFRFAHAGTDSWYFGLDDFGLYSINAGELPSVAGATSRKLRLSAGTTARFVVEATGQPPLSYQWLRDGAPVTGGTNATLELPASTENQGVFTVAVSNPAGTIVVQAGQLTVYAPRVTGQWDFEEGDLRATKGSALEYLGGTESLTTFARRLIGGASSGVMGFGSTGIDQGYRMRHGARPNGGGQFINQYTLVFDLYYPASSQNEWRALWQTDPFNHDGNDADFYVGDGASAPVANGIGIEGLYHGALSPDQWHRIAFAVDLTAPTASRLTKYVDGVRVATQPLAEGIDGRHALGPSALLFTTGDRTGIYTRPGFVSSIQFVDGWLPEAALTSLGVPAASGIPSREPALRIEAPSVQANALSFQWAGGTAPFQVQRSSRLEEEYWENVGPLLSNRFVSLPANGDFLFYRVTEWRPPVSLGPQPEGEHVVTTLQWVRPSGLTLRYGGRPVDIALAPDGTTLYAKDNNGIAAIDINTWTLRQQLPFGNAGGSMHGLAVNAAGTRVYATTAQNQLCEATVGAGGTLSWSRRLTLPDASVGGAPFPCGIALSSDATRAYVCLSRNNTLAVVNLQTGALVRQIPTGIAPFDVVLSPAGGMAYVSDWGGRRPNAGERKAKSSGTDVLVDAHGVAASGTVSFIDLTQNVVTATIPTGLHPSDLVLNADGSLLYCANANSDSVSVIATGNATVRETISVRPDPALPYGSAANALALSPDGRRLFVANGGNNAIALVALPEGARTSSQLEGFLPADWYPGAVVTDGRFVYVANVKGVGSRNDAATAAARSVHSFLGTLSKLSVPEPESLSKLTAQVQEDARVPHILRAWEQARSGQPPRPVPRRVGEPSLFQHVIYVIKENRTYDQIFGDLPQGNSSPALCIFGRAVTPNHHALAEQFVLLDNFYCNGVNSADGHAWATEGHVADYLEKSFGGTTRSYPWGDDALSYSATGFIWDNVLLHGLSFRNYGEMDYAEPIPAGASWLTVYRDFINGTRTIQFSQNIGIEPLRPYSVAGFPGWNMRIPDVLRADRFIRDVQAAELTGNWPDFTILYLPNDHTTGTSPGSPTPRAQVADNDLALGRAIDAFSHSRFWSNSVFFVIEDDPSDGFDHVDGHRSIGLVVSPYTKRGAVVSEFYNQTAVLHTMERILGIPPMNQMDALSPLMTVCFTSNPDFRPYTALPNTIPLDEMNPGTAGLPSRERYWARQSMAQNFAQFDRADEDTMNRILWHSVKGVNTRYPSRLAGAHGKGLKKLGLKLTPAEEDDD